MDIKYEELGDSHHALVDLVRFLGISSVIIDDDDTVTIFYKNAKNEPIRTSDA
jgi:hypothetical protein